MLSYHLLNPSTTSTPKSKHRLKEAIAYRRVSTDQQSETGVGLEGQLAAIERYAELDRYRIIESFQDVGSGRGRRNLVDRPGLQEAITLAKATGRPLIVSDLDRLSREAATVDAIIREHGIEVISAGDGELRNPVIVASKAARAEREGNLISERTKEGMARKKAEGVQFGNPKIHIARQKAVLRKKELADASVAAIVEILEEHAGQDLTAGQLVDLLNQRGILTSTKRPWTVPAVRRPLKVARLRVQERKRSETFEHYKNNPLWGRF